MRVEQTGSLCRGHHFRPINSVVAAFIDSFLESSRFPGTTEKEMFRKQQLMLRCLVVRLSAKQLIELFDELSDQKQETRDKRESIRADDSSTPVSIFFRVPAALETNDDDWHRRLKEKKRNCERTFPNPSFRFSSIPASGKFFRNKFQLSPKRKVSKLKSCSAINPNECFACSRTATFHHSPENFHE